MSKKAVVIGIGVLFLLVMVLTMNSHAIRFEGNAWVAQHIGRDGPTNDFFFVIDPMGTAIDVESLDINKFSITPSTERLDFSQLTQADDLLWFEIEDFEGSKSYYNFRFNDLTGKTYTGRALYAEFNNPVGNSTLPVPEPTTLLLLGCGIIGLAAWRRKKFSGQFS